MADPTEIPDVNYDPSAGDSATMLKSEATTVGTLAGDALSKKGPGGGTIGDVPDYVGLMAKIDALSKQSVTLPPDLLAAMDNEAMNQLGSHEMTTAIQGGNEALAARQQLGDQVGNVAATGNMTATRKAANAASQAGSGVALKEASQAGDQAQSVLSAESQNKLQRFIQEGQALHANASNANNTYGMSTGLWNAASSGLEATRGIANSALGALAAATLANNQTQFGTEMSLVRGGISALSGATSTLSSLKSGSDTGDRSNLSLDSGSSTPGGSGSGVGGGGPASDI